MRVDVPDEMTAAQVGFRPRHTAEVQEDEDGRYIDLPEGHVETITDVWEEKYGVEYEDGELVTSGEDAPLNSFADASEDDEGEEEPEEEDNEDEEE